MAKDRAIDHVNGEASENAGKQDNFQLQILALRQSLGSFTVTPKAEMTDSLAQQFGTCSLEGANTKPSAGDERPSRFVPDVSLINESSGRPPLEYPFIGKFQKDDATLYYLASRHKPISASFPLIEDAIEKAHPDVVIIEGQSGRVAADQIHPGQSEMDYAAMLAAEKDIPVFGGDASHAQVFQYLKDHGYSAEDFVNQQFTLKITEMSRKQLPDKETLEAEYNKMAKGVLKDLHQFCNVPEGKQFDFQGFEKWYEKMAGKPFEPSDFADGHAPPPKIDGTPLEKMFALVNQARNPAMVKAIADAVNHHKRVLVIYGGTHFMQQQAVMEEMFGNPQLMGTWQ